MCGIAGVIDTMTSSARDTLATRTAKMTDSLAHRGPDDKGLWIDAEAGIGLGHRRLAIVDLSPEGHQPMGSMSNRFIIIYNGEIYNFLELRRELEGLGIRFRGHSDTEVMLAAIERFGLEGTLPKLAGMFAMALWDRQERLLHLVRDRVGKKPLYFGWVGSTFLFASELKAFHTHPDFTPEIDPAALASFLRFCYVPAPGSIYRDIFKLPPATTLRLRFNGGNLPRGQALLEHLETFWSAEGVAEAGRRAPFSGSDEAAIEALDEQLGLAVTQRMIADVPLGAFLSGGIDSSVVVALMQKHSSRPVRTFSIGFGEAAYDEAADAKRVARHLGTDHTELYVPPGEALDVIPSLPIIYDEPFADSSQIPTHLVSRLTRRSVTVALSGDGGDESFGGYRRYFQAARLERLNQLPGPLRQAMAGLVQTLPPHGWDRLFALLPLLPDRVRRALTGERVHKFAGILPAQGQGGLYEAMTSQWTAPTSVLQGDSQELASVVTNPGRWPTFDSFAHTMMLLDTITYLPDDILTKVDRASMAVALEARAPLLDHRVIEFAWQLPLSMKIRHGQGKWILRQVLQRYVPPELFERPKQGFGFPLGTWLRGPLRDWAESLLDERRLQQDGFFRLQPIRKMWYEHLSGRRNFGHHLWNVLMFQAWHEQWQPSPAGLSA